MVTYLRWGTNTDMDVIGVPEVCIVSLLCKWNCTHQSPWELQLVQSFVCLIHLFNEIMLLFEAEVGRMFTDDSAATLFSPIMMSLLEDEAYVPRHWTNLCLSCANKVQEQTKRSSADESMLMDVDISVHELILCLYALRLLSFQWNVPVACFHHIRKRRICPVKETLQLCLPAALWALMFLLPQC